MIFKKTIFVLLGMTLLLSACGFHLRGRMPLPIQLQNLTIRSDSPYSEFSKQLKNTLRDLGVTIKDNAARSVYTLQIISAVNSEIVGSISSSTNTRIYTLYFTVNYQLLDQQGKIILPAQTVSSYRTLTVNANQVLGSSIEELTLQREMRSDVIEKMLYRLSAHNTRKLLNGQNVTSQKSE